MNIIPNTLFMKNVSSEEALYVVMPEFINNGSFRVETKSFGIAQPIYQGLRFLIVDGFFELNLLTDKLTGCTK